MFKPSQTHVRESRQLVVRGKDRVYGVIFQTVGGVTWWGRGTLAAVRTGSQRTKTGTQKEQITFLVQVNRVMS